MGIFSKNISNAEIEGIKIEIKSINARINMMDLEQSKIIQHIKNLRGSINRNKKDEIEESEEDEEGKGIKGTKYY